MLVHRAGYFQKEKNQISLKISLTGRQTVNVSKSLSYIILKTVFLLLIYIYMLTLVLNNLLGYYRDQRHATVIILQHTTICFSNLSNQIYIGLIMTL